MKENADHCLRLTLKHEGGFVDHPKDPGGATNRGVTIGTLKRLGIDKDGDGDSDIADLRLLTEADAVRVFKRFYWDAVQADLLPSGVDYAVADFAVNSGPTRAAEYLQRVLGVEVDGHIGPKTMAAIAGADPVAVVNAISDRRLAFVRKLPTWGTFGRGWARRIDEVRQEGKRLAAMGDTRSASPAPEFVDARPPAPKPVAVSDDALQPRQTGWSALLSALVAWVEKRV